MTLGNVAHIRNPSQKTQQVKFTRGIISPIEERNISQETAEKYGVEKLFYDGVYYGYSFPLFDKDGEFTAQKVKQTNPKKMKIIGDIAKGQMFGMKAFPRGGKFITITEGEEDALAAYQMLKVTSKGIEPPVISLNFGAGNSALRECKKHWEYINSFDTIILSFDGDAIGKETAENVAKLFPFKVKIMRFPDAVKNDEGEWELKDASDYSKKNKSKEFTSLWWKAERFVPKGVRTFQSLWDDMTRVELNTIVPFPWEGVNKMCEGMITGKMDVFKAHPKIGKTTVLSELVMHIRDTSPHNVGVIFLENTAREIGLKLCGIRMNQPIDRPNAKIDWDELKEAHGDISEDDRIMIFDPQDERTAENIFNKIMYFVKAHDCKYIFLDHASMLAYTSENMDERKFLDKLFADLKQMTTSLNIYLGVVIHVNDDGKTRGSRAPVQLCDRLYSLQRDKLNTDEVISNTTEFIVEENRYGAAGIASHLYYDNITGRMSEMDMDLMMEKQNEEREVKFDD